MKRSTRKPTGKPPWPIGLLAGVQKAGKSFACAQASASDLIGKTFWIGVGEDDPDEYGLIPGADFDIVEHDGTIADITQAVLDAAAEPSDPNRPNLIVVDSVTPIWDLLSDTAEKTAAARPSYRGSVPMDLWNKAATDWRRFMDAIRSHNGPVLLTARLDQVAVMKNGKPTTDKEWKIKGHKSLPFDVGFIVEFEGRGQAVITGTRSLRHDVRTGERKPFNDFTVDTMWRALGLGPDATTPRQHAGTQTVVPDEPGLVSLSPDEWRARLESVRTDVDGLLALKEDAEKAGLPKPFIDQINYAGMALSTKEN